MSTKALEKAIEDEAVELAAEDGFRAAKLDRIKRSDPDRLFYHPVGASFLVEFKRPGEKPRPQQAKRIRDLRAKGFEVHVIDNVDDFKHLLQFQRRVVRRLEKYLDRVTQQALERGFL